MVIKEGQIWRGSDYGTYVVTKEYCFAGQSKSRYDLINYEGITVEGISYTSFEEDTLIAEYPNWLEAVRSKDFRENINDYMD